MASSTRFGRTAPTEAVVTGWARAIDDTGECSFLLSNGQWLFAHASTQLSCVVRQAPFSKAHLKDADMTVDFSAVTTPDDRVAVIATTPLTDDEEWTGNPPRTCGCSATALSCGRP